jgi:glutamate racemase
LEEVRGFALDICRFLVDHGAKMIVMACNISSAVAVDAARAEFPGIPILGVIEPGAHAALAGRRRRIGVLATAGTVQSGAYPRTVHSLDPAAAVEQVACPLFVPLVERGETESDNALRASCAYLAPLAEFGAENIILGCTHYPFLRRVLERAASRIFPGDLQPVFIDPALECACSVQKIVAGLHRSPEIRRDPPYRYFVSGDVAHFQLHGSAFLGRSIEHAESADASLSLA